MNKTELLQQVSNLSIWKRHDERAPHKPLLVLLYLGRLQAGKPRMALFSEIEPKLTELLQEFGPSRKSYHPEQPFCRLRSDNIWELSVDTPSSVLTKTILREQQVSGGFIEPVFELLRSNPNLVDQVATMLLQQHYPGDTYHQDILDAVGLDITFSEEGEGKRKKRRVRDPEFRRRILEVYDYRCAICGFDVRLGNLPIALEAAHIQWFQSGGPDIETNGLALCSLHHKLLDRGAIGIARDHTILVSDKANGTGGFEEWVLNFDGQPLRQPRQTVYTPQTEFTDWHIREVFKGKYGYSR